MEEVASQETFGYASRQLITVYPHRSEIRNYKIYALVYVNILLIARLSLSCYFRQKLL